MSSAGGSFAVEGGAGVVGDAEFDDLDDQPAPLFAAADGPSLPGLAALDVFMRVSARHAVVRYARNLI